MPSTGRTVAVASVPGDREEPQRPAAGASSGGCELRDGPGVQEWDDGSTYEGVFVGGLKHGNGKYTWARGEHYEGSFYKDYRHGSGKYSWPSGHKFTGKFYLNRKEGYGHLLFPDGSTFQGLYNCDQRFGPGLMNYPDGCSDVGFWVGERLLKLCAPVEDGFSLRRFPEYAAYIGCTDTLTQPHSSDLQRDPTVESNPDLPSDETFILPCGIESYSTDGDHLPLPPGRRRELDQHFFAELWEPDAQQHQGYERDPLSSLPLVARMQAHIHKHRLQAEALGWDVGAVLSLNRGSFGPKGPLEVNSELLIHNASIGDLQAVSQILRNGVVHPDVADSNGHTALIAATINCHIDIIHLLLDVGVDIDKLNCEGMSALAVCHVLHYHHQSQRDNLVESAAVNQVFESLTLSEGDLTTEPPKTVNSVLNSLTSHSCIRDETELTEHIEQTSTSMDSELTAECRPRCLEPNYPSEYEEERQEIGEEALEGWAGGKNQEFWENVGVSSGSVQFNGKEESDGIAEDNIDVGKMRESPSGNERMEPKEKDEDDSAEAQETGSAGVEHSIQVLDGDMALGSVQWSYCQLETAERIQTKDEELNSGPTFDSARSLKSFSIHVTEEAIQRSAEVLSRAGFHQSSDTNETVRKMAAMKTEHRLRLDTLKLLLERGADPNISRVPMPVIFLAIMAADVEAVRRLLLCGARTDIPLPPEKKGLYPLHVAASLPGPAGPIITELLLHAVTDPDARACDQDEVYEPDKVLMKPQDLQNAGGNLSPKEGGRTALHVACMRESDHHNASKVVALLLSHSASTDLLWSGHSPLSLAIATGNDLAVEELLKGGADPNIPLGSRVGSALCALTNFHYRLCGNRTKLLDMLAKAGADFTMPVKLNGAFGTAVDSAYHSFNQDLRIAKTPFHALNLRERETFKERRNLLSIMGNLLRETAVQREQENMERARQCDNSTMTTGAISLDLPRGQVSAAEGQRSQVTKFCYHCGRSAYVKLSSCNRCGRVFYCSRSCRLKGWDERHKHECSRTTASADVVRKRMAFKSLRASRTPSATLNSKAFPNALSIEEDFLYTLNLKENYSFN